MTTEQASSTHEACSLFFENEEQCRAVSLLAGNFILTQQWRTSGGDKEGNRPQISSDFEKCDKESLVVVRNKQYQRSRRRGGRGPWPPYFLLR